MKKYYITKLMNVADKCIYIKVTEDLHSLVHDLKGLKDVPDFERICDVRYLVTDNITDCRLIYLFYVHQIGPEYNNLTGFLKPSIELKMPYDWTSYHEKYSRVYPYSFRDSVEWYTDHCGEFNGKIKWPRNTLEESKFLITEYVELYGEPPHTLEEARIIYCAVTPTDKLIRELTKHLVELNKEYVSTELRDQMNDELDRYGIVHRVTKKQVNRVFRKVKIIPNTNKIIIERV